MRILAKFVSQNRQDAGNFVKLSSIRSVWLEVDVTAGYSFPMKHIIERAICINRLVLTINHVRFYDQKG